MNAPAIVTPDRKTFIGGSDIAAILGVSKWKTALQLWLEKTGRVVVEPIDPERERRLKRGKRLEPVVLEMLLDERGVSPVARNQRYVDPVHPFMACEIDAEADDEGERVNLEVKTSHQFAGDQWGDEGTDQIDVGYAAQAMWGLGITGRRRCIFAVLIGSDNLCTYEIVRDDETIAAMRAKALDFWQNHVLTGVPPEPVNLPDVLELFGRKPSSRIEATEEVLTWLQQLAAARDAAKAAEDAEVECKYQIGRYMLGVGGITLLNGGKLVPGAEVKVGDHLLTLKGMPLLVISKQQQQRLDNDAVRTKHPEVAAECMKSIEFFKFGKPKKGMQ